MHVFLITLTAIAAVMLIAAVTISLVALWGQVLRDSPRLRDILRRR